MINKILKSITVINIVFILFIVLFYNDIIRMFKINENTHRLQWWLDYINWDIEDREEIERQKWVKVALIDSGVNVHHMDFYDSSILEILIGMESNEQVLNDNNDYEHGTAMAGIMVAKPLQEDGILGINPMCDVYSLDISTNKTDVSVEKMIEAVRFAILNKVDVINISIAMEEDNEELHKIIKRAYDANITIVAASGNNVNGEQKVYPAEYEEVISVNSVDKEGNVLYSCEKYDVLAPGKNIVTTYSSVYNEEKYISIDGTSASSSIISGVVSLIYQYNEDIKNYDIYNYFRERKNEKINVNQVVDTLCN